MNEQERIDGLMRDGDRLDGAVLVGLAMSDGKALEQERQRFKVRLQSDDAGTPQSTRAEALQRVAVILATLRAPAPQRDDAPQTEASGGH